MTLERRAVTSLKGVGPALAKRLARLGIENVADLLFWLPTRYEDRTHIVPIGSLRPGMRAAVEGAIELAEVVFRGRRSIMPPSTRDGDPLALGNSPDVVPGPEDTYASYGQAWANLSNTPFRLYKRWVHEGGISTPMDDGSTVAPEASARRQCQLMPEG